MCVCGCHHITLSLHRIRVCVWCVSEYTTRNASRITTISHNGLFTSVIFIGPKMMVIRRGAGRAICALSIAIAVCASRATTHIGDAERDAGYAFSTNKFVSHHILHDNNKRGSSFFVWLWPCIQNSIFWIPEIPQMANGEIDRIAFFLLSSFALTDIEENGLRSCIAHLWISQHQPSGVSCKIYICFLPICCLHRLSDQISSAPICWGNSFPSICIDYTYYPMNTGECIDSSEGAYAPHSYPTELYALKFVLNAYSPSFEMHIYDALHRLAIEKKTPMATAHCLDVCVPHWMQFAFFVAFVLVSRISLSCLVSEYSAITKELSMEIHILQPDAVIIPRQNRTHTQNALIKFQSSSSLHCVTYANKYSRCRNPYLPSHEKNGNFYSTHTEYSTVVGCDANNTRMWWEENLINPSVLFCVLYSFMYIFCCPRSFVCFNLFAWL